MNGKKAKALRRSSEEAFEKERDYATISVRSRRRGASNLTILIAYCSRRLYKHLKSEYKKRAP